MNKYRSHTCNELRKNNVGKSIVISGWINKKRDHGNLLFIDLRDNYGITQCIIDQENKNFKELEQQIKKRDRSFEKEIKLSYLKKLEKAYHLIIKNFEFPILEYSLDNIDFNKNQFEFEKILRAIFRASF